MSRAEPLRDVAGTVTVPDDRTDRFIELSAFLTGYGRVRLIGTGLTAAYLRVLDAALPPGTLEELFDAFERLPGGAAREAGAVTAILDQPKLGPVARNLILLWYCGTWTALTDDWHAAYGTEPLVATHVVSAAAYQSGLQWTAAGAHPPGARQQGFGAWAEAPPGPDAPAATAAPAAPAVPAMREAPGEPRG